MKKVAIDFETYYDHECTVAGLGAVKYAVHPKFDALMVSFYSDDLRYVGPVESAPWDEINGLVWIAHNATFEAAIVDYYLPNIGINAKPAHWIDSSHLAVFNGYPRSLKDAAKMVLDVDISKQIRDDLMGVTRDQLYGPNPQFDMAALEHYCLQDSKLSYELTEKLSMPPQFQKLSEWVVEMEMKGQVIDSDLINASLDRLETEGEALVLSLPWGKEVVDHCKKEGISVYDHTSVKTSATKNTIDARSEGVPEHRIARLKTGYAITLVPAVTSLAELRHFLKATDRFHGKLPTSFNKSVPAFQRFYDKHSNSLPELKAFIEFKEMNKLVNDLRKLKNLSVDGVYHGSLSFFGAHTGRFSGSDRGASTGGGGARGKFNLQNITNGERFGVRMRDMLIAPKNKVYFTADLAQIEARLGSYYSNDWATLKEVAKGISIYEVHARNVLGYSGPAPLKHHDPQLYKRAKAEVLSLQYAQGLAKYFDKNQDTFATLADAEISFCEWREKKQDVQQVWKILNKRASDAAKQTAAYTKFHFQLDVEKVFTDPNEKDLQNRLNAHYRKNNVGVCKVKVHNDRTLHYYGCVAVPVVMSWGGVGKEISGVFSNMMRRKMYGGSLLENLCQAAASDILHEKLVIMRDAGIDVRLVVHDEIDGYVANLDEINKIKEIMCAPSPLFPNLPLDCEIHVGRTFTSPHLIYPTKDPASVFSEVSPK